MTYVDVDPEMETLKHNYQRNRQWAKRGSYMTTLAPREEQEFQGWLYKNKIPYNSKWPADQAMQDYDMRGYWKALQAGDPRAAQDSETQHFPDEWKTPYHKSFSADSLYATPTAPKWRGNKLVDDKGNVIYQEEPP